MTHHKPTAMPMLRSNYRMIVIGIAVLWLASPLTIGLHHHADERQHADCPICIAGSLFSPGHMGDRVSLGYHPIIVCTQYREATIHHTVTEVSILTIRAPPVRPAV